MEQVAEQTSQVIEENPSVEESTVTETTTQETSNNETQSNESTGVNHWDANTWGLEGVPENVLEKINANLKNAQGYSDKVINKKLEELKGKKTFDKVEDVLQDEDVRNYISSRLQEEQKIREETAKNKDNYLYHLDNWDKLQESDQRAFFDKLTEEQKVNFATAIDSKRTKFEKTQLEQKIQHEKLEQELTEKYPDYKEYSPKIDAYIQEIRKSGKNALRELVYALISREDYGKSQYEKGLNEVNQKQELINSLNGLTSNSEKLSTEREIFDKALAEAGVTDDEDLSSLS